MTSTPRDSNGGPHAASAAHQPLTGAPVRERFDGPALARVSVRGVPRLALWRAGGLLDLGAHTTLDELLRLRRDEVHALVDAIDPDPIEGPDLAWLAPCESQEVWAAGVTYRRSREARVEEAEHGDFYARVYRAERPELFFKAAGWRVVPHGGEIGYRSDSDWNVPEPELAVLVNRFGEVVAVSCGNDASSRRIEGENPLYLPQAKVYDRSCALGPVAALVGDPDAPAEITIEIEREGEVVYGATATTGDMVRRPSELAAALTSAYALPVGGWLLTGTALVPPDEYTMRDGDVCRIGVERVGTLTNAARAVAVSTVAPAPASATAAGA